MKVSTQRDTGMCNLGEWYDTLRFSFLWNARKEVTYQLFPVYTLRTYDVVKLTFGQSMEFTEKGTAR